MHIHISVQTSGIDKCYIMCCWILNVFSMIFTDMNETRDFNIDVQLIFLRLGIH